MIITTWWTRELVRWEHYLHKGLEMMRANRSSKNIYIRDVMLVVYQSFVRTFYRYLQNGIMLFYLETTCFFLNVDY